MPERVLNTKRQMLPDTYEYYRARKTHLEQLLKELGSDRESGHQRQALHDDAGSVFAENQAREELERIGDLSLVEIIKPPKEADKVALGTRVTLQFEGEKELLMAVVGAQDDAQAAIEGRIVISCLSPLGKVLMGKSVGVEVSYRTATLQTARIVGISIE